MKKTSVPRTAASAAKSSRPGSCAATAVTLPLTPRWVTGMPAAAGHSAERRDAGHDLERDAGRGEREGLLPAAPEDERVAALEADDRAALRAVRDEQRVDRFLRAAVAGDADRDPRRLGDELARDEPVVDEHLARAHELEPAHRDQAGIARVPRRRA